MKNVCQKSFFFSPHLLSYHQDLALLFDTSFTLNLYTSYRTLESVGNSGMEEVEAKLDETSYQADDAGGVRVGEAEVQIGNPGGAVKSSGGDGSGGIVGVTDRCARLSICHLSIIKP